MEVNTPTRRTFAKNAYLQHTLTRRHRPPLVTFLLLLHDFFGGAMVSFLYILGKHSSNTRPHDVCGPHKQPTPFYRCIHIPTTSVHATVVHFCRARARKWRYGHLKTMNNNNTPTPRRLPLYYPLLPSAAALLPTTPGGPPSTTQTTVLGAGTSRPRGPRPK